MSLSVNIAGVWKTATAFVKVAGAWKQATGYINAAGVWKSATEKVATPALGGVDIPGAPSNMTKQVTLTCATSGATIYWRTSTGSGWTTYATYVTVPVGYTLYAYATKAGMADSDVYVGYLG